MTIHVSDATTVSTHGKLRWHWLRVGAGRPSIFHC